MCQIFGTALGLSQQAAFKLIADWPEISELWRSRH
jgi:hypothetical protein